MGNLFYKLLKITLPIILSILFLNCAATIQDLSKVQYVKEGLNTDSLFLYGIALLPVVAGQGQEGYRRPFGNAINENIKNELPNLKFLPWQKSMDLLNEYSLTEEYQAIISQYQTTAIIDKNLMRDLGDALDVRYLLFVSLEDFSKSKSTTYNVFFGWSTTKTAIVNGFVQLWDCMDGDVAWEGYGTAYSEGGELTYEKDYIEYSNVAAKGLVRKLFNIQTGKSKKTGGPYDTWKRDDN